MAGTERKVYYSELLLPIGFLANFLGTTSTQLGFQNCSVLCGRVVNAIAIP